MRKETERKSRLNPKDLFGIALVIGATYFINFAQRTGEWGNLREELGKSEIRLEDLRSTTAHYKRLSDYLNENPEVTIPLEYGTLFMYDGQPMFGGSRGSAPLDTIIQDNNERIKSDKKALENLRDKVKSTRRKAVWFF